MTPTVSSSTSAAPEASPPPAPTANQMVSKNMFLQLLVAQIKNQDPLNPADGVQFLTQLAQFTEVEQTLSMSTDLSAIRADLHQIVPPPQTDQQP
jgi:flagellar basal-body rod modification protein FlgD